MENASLNKAHQQHRRADALLKYKKFSEAIECHEKAAELLEEALKTTDNPLSLESLKLQKDYHSRQKNVILMKKQQSEKSKKAHDNNKEALSNICENNHSVDDNVSLQSAIYRTFEEADTLLFLLMKKGSSGNSDTESLKSVDAGALSYDVIDTPNLNNILGSKFPKDDTVVIEELKTLNDQLRSLISHLLVQLDDSSREIVRLRERVKELEGSDNKVLSKGNSNNLKVITDSSGGTSPYVFSPCSELSPDLYEIKPIPPLAPLEIPNFDFSKFSKLSEK